MGRRKENDWGNVEYLRREMEVENEYMRYIENFVRPKAGKRL